MIKKSLIEEVKDRLVATYNPLQIYLFGSYAWGTPDEESDLDLLVVVEKSDEKTYHRPIPGYEALQGLGVPNDIIVCTKNEFDRQAAAVTTLIHKIVNQGKKIYERT